MYSHIFQIAESSNKPEAKPNKGVTDDSKKFARELATLNYGLYQKDKVVKERREASQRPVAKVIGNITTFSSLESMYNMVDDEIDTVLKKTPWKRLADKWKWKFINEFIDRCPNMNKKDRQYVKKVVKTEHASLLESDVEYSVADLQVLKLDVCVTLPSGALVHL